MKPKKDLIKVAEADGSIDRLNRLLSAAHILNCEANMLVETEKSKMDMFRDMDDFDAKFREWVKLPSDWKPKEVKQ